VAPLTLESKITCRRGEEHALFVRLRRGREPAVREALIERYMPLARHLARRYPAGTEREDVVQVASLALVKAVDRFDPGQGSAFTSFATPTILGEIKRYFRDFGWSVHVPRKLQERVQRIERATHTLTARRGRAPTPAEIAADLGVSVEEVLDARATATAHRPEPLEPDSRDDDRHRAPPSADEPGYERVEQADTVASLLSRLPDRDRRIVELRFQDELLQREIAAVVGLSQMQVSRILSHSLARLSETAD
jgi:RNA polymerase sigma-B factor